MYTNTIIVSETTASGENGMWKTCAYFDFNTPKVISCRVQITKLHLEDSNAIQNIIIIVIMIIIIANIFEF